MSRWTLQDLYRTSWFDPLREQIQSELDALSAAQHDARPALEKDQEELRQQIQGWSLSLAKPELSPALRAVLEKEVEAAVQRQQEVERQLAEVDALRQRAETVVDAQQVVDRLNRLAQVLATQSPSRTNLELSLHIDALRCYQGGRVVVRTCKLGALAGSTDLLARPGDGCARGSAGDSEAMTAKPRRRAVRRVAADDGNQADLQAAAHQAADVDRFTGLGPEWFWEDTLQVPRKTCWSEEHASEVAAKKQEMGWSLAKLAEYFVKSIPTVRRALQLAQEQDTQRANGDQPPG
jgi:hypothetical protein